MNTWAPNDRMNSCPSMAKPLKLERRAAHTSTKAFATALSRNANGAARKPVAVLAAAMISGESGASILEIARLTTKASMAPRPCKKMTGRSLKRNVVFMNASGWDDRELFLLQRGNGQCSQADAQQVDPVARVERAQDVEHDHSHTHGDSDALQGDGNDVL